MSRNIANNNWKIIDRRKQSHHVCRICYKVNRNPVFVTLLISSQKVLRNLDFVEQLKTLPSFDLLTGWYYFCLNYIKVS